MQVSGENKNPFGLHKGCIPASQNLVFDKQVKTLPETNIQN